MFGWVKWALINLYCWLRGLTMTYSKIDDGVYQGGRVDQFPDDVTAVVNLEMENDAAFPKPLNAYLWMPINDGPFFPGVPWLHTATTFIDQCRKAGWSVLIHCTAGVSRSGMVDVAYHMFKNRWTRDQALAYIREKCPQTDPNPTFMKGLLGYQEWLGLGVTT